MTFDIRVKNHLNPCWLKWFDSWKITNFEDGEVLLSAAHFTTKFMVLIGT